MINFTKEECEKIISLSNVLEQNIRDDSNRFISYDFYSIGYCEDYKWIFDSLVSGDNTKSRAVPYSNSMG